MRRLRSTNQRRRPGLAVAAPLAAGLAIAASGLASATVVRAAPAPPQPFHNPAHHHTATSKPSKPFLPSTSARMTRFVAQQTFTVNTTADGVDATPGDGHCATATSTCTLRAAIQEADFTNTPTAIVLPASTVTLSIAPSGADGITTGDLNITDTGGVAVIGVAGGGSTVDGAGLDRVFAITGATAVTITDVTVTGGHATAASDISASGGGIGVLSVQSELTLDHSVISNSTADLDGGGIYNDGKLWLLGSTLTGNIAGDTSAGNSAGGGGLFDHYGSAQVTGSTISANHSADHGGGIAHYDGALAIVDSTITGNAVNTTGTTIAEGGGIFADDETTVMRSHIDANTATSTGTVAAKGGGVYDHYALEWIRQSTVDGNHVTAAAGQQAGGGGVFDGSGVTIQDSEVKGNSAADSGGANGFGGGVDNEGDGVTLIHDTIANNVSGDFGGGIYSNDAASIDETVFSGNTAVHGGALYNDDGQLIRHSTFSGNHATRGGAFFLDWQIQVENSTIAGNVASGTLNQGGAIFLDASNGRADLHFVTVSGNVSDDGAGLWDASAPGTATSFQLDSTILAGNRTAGGTASNCDVTNNPVTSTGWNLEDANTCGLGGPHDLTTTNPLLGTLQNNGGATATEALLAGSPAIDAGHNLNCPADDQRGMPRPQLSGCDIGAVEFSLAGYWMVASDGGVFPFGNAGGYGSTGGIHLNQPIVGMGVMPDRGGYFLVAADGGIFPFGDATPGLGSTGGIHLNQPIVGMAVTRSGRGYWLVAADGGIFPFGDATAHSYGSTGGIHLNKPIVGMAATADGNGYYLVATDGGIFPFGDARQQSYGSEGGQQLNLPIVGMAVPPGGGGYWLVASDGGIFPFGPGAGGFGSTGGIHLNRPIVGMSPTSTGRGYWLAASDGGIFPFGDAFGFGSLGGAPLNQPIVGIAS